MTLSNGDTLTVKQRLTNGETRAAYERMLGADGTTKSNPLGTAMAVVTAYLVDWHLAGEDVPIRALSVDDLATVLDNLTPDDFEEIRVAIDGHEAAMAAERAAAKNAQGGGKESAATSPSPSAAGGPSTKSEG